MEKQIFEAMEDLAGRRPNIDMALVVLEQSLHLPLGSARLFPVTAWCQSGASEPALYGGR